MTKIYNTLVKDMVCPKCGSDKVMIDAWDADVLDDTCVEVCSILCHTCEHENDFTAYYKLAYIELEETEDESD